MYGGFNGGGMVVWLYSFSMYGVMVMWVFVGLFNWEFVGVEVWRESLVVVVVMVLN